MCGCAGTDGLAGLRARLGWVTGERQRGKRKQSACVVGSGEVWRCLLLGLTPTHGMARVNNVKGRWRLCFVAHMVAARLADFPRLPACGVRLELLKQCGLYRGSPALACTGPWELTLNAPLYVLADGRADAN